ncbi:MAG: HAD family phosphatase [Clostridia bacterium]|nr:HAD family phosphatase [Clostridia bacterium]
MENIRYAIFDLDGTLTDSMHIWDTCGGAYLMMRGITPHAGETFRTRGYREGITYMIEEYNLPMTYDELMAELLKILEYYYFNIAEAKSGVKEFLEKMEKNGAKMCIISATNQYLVDAALKRNGIDKYFCKVYSTTDIGKHKDNPEIFNIAKEFLGAENSGEVFVFEDALYSIKTAKSAGYKVIGIEDYSAEPDREKIKELSDYYITDYSEIYNYLNLD